MIASITRPLIAGLFISLTNSPAICQVKNLAAGGRIAVVCQDDGSITEIDPQSNRADATIRVGKKPAGIAASPEGSRVYITYPEGHRIDIIDSQSGNLMRSLPFDGEPFGIAVSLDYIFVADWANDTVTRISIDGKQAAVTTAVGRSPATLLFDLASQRLYVADRMSNDVTIIDAQSMQKITTIPTGVAPFALALSPQGAHLYTANVQGNSVTVIDSLRLRAEATFAVGNMPYGVAVTTDGAKLLVTIQHGNELTIFDTGSLKAIASIPVGLYPEGVFAGAQGVAYVANWFSGDVSIIDIERHVERSRIKVGDGPRGFAYLAEMAKRP